MTRIKITGILLVGVLILAGCTPVERTAYNTIVAAKAFLDQEKLSHPECTTATTTICVDLKKAVAAKDLMIDALEVYCAGPTFDTGTGACNAPAKGTAAYTQAVAKLNAAIANYNQTASDLKGATK